MLAKKPNLEPNTKSIGWRVAELLPFEVFHTLAGERTPETGYRRLQLILYSAQCCSAMQRIGQTMIRCFNVSETSRNCADREDYPTDGCSQTNSSCTCVCGWELCNIASITEVIANCTRDQEVKDGAVMTTRDSAEVKDDNNGAVMTSSSLGHVITLLISVITGYLLWRLFIHLDDDDTEAAAADDDEDDNPGGGYKISYDHLFKTLDLS